MNERTCSMPDCSRPHRSLGLCESHYQRARYKPVPQAERACRECDKTFLSGRPNKRYCTAECQLIASEREWKAKRTQPWDEQRRARYHEREARKRGNGYEHFTRAEIAERDRWTCGLCDELIDRDLNYPNPMSLSLDHVLPLSLGGPHTRANTQAAHLRCNISKGNRAVGEQLALI